MATNARRGFFRTAFDAMIAAREKQVQRYVNSAILTLDDETLRANGVTREQLRGARHFTSII
ncbi:MAG: hypothetical protein WDZ83_16535 [Rhizobiaceae bacterium]